MIISGKHFWKFNGWEWGNPPPQKKKKLWYVCTSPWPTLVWFSLYSHLLNILSLGQCRTKYSLLQFFPVARRSHSHWREFQDLFLGSCLNPWADTPNSPCHGTTTQCCPRTCSTLTGTLLPHPGPVLPAGLSGNQEVSRDPKMIQWCPEMETG